VWFLGQTELFNWFIVQRLTGEHKFFSIEEIKKLTKTQGYDIGGENRHICINRQVRRLYAYGYLEIKIKYIRPASYRVKAKYLNGRKAPG
jgi:hypothetical protein